MAELLTGKIAEMVGGELTGPDDVTISGLEVVSMAGPGQLTMIGQEKYAAQWAECKASAVLVQAEIELPETDGRPLIRVKDVDHATVPLLEAFAPPTPRVDGIHDTAVIDPSAILEPGVSVGPHCCIGSGTRIGAGSMLHANVVIESDVSIGQGCEFWSGVVIRERCQIGHACIFHMNVSIGADGFGYRPDPSGAGLVKIPQIGNVVIGNGVEIGANSAVDRAKFSSTIIGDGTKIDNLVQIGHNCRIGRCCVIAGMAGIAGSVTMGDGVIIGGLAAIKDHLHLGDGCTIAGDAAVMDDVPAGETWAGYPAKQYKHAAREVLATAKLPGLMKKLQRWARKNGIDLE